MPIESFARRVEELTQDNRNAVGARPALRLAQNSGDASPWLREFAAMNPNAVAWLLVRISKLDFAPEQHRVQRAKISMFSVVVAYGREGGRHREVGRRRVTPVFATCGRSAD
ncbi:hypothetical protein HNR40_009588 [Nonomuraea endophytica]|uniref:Uncharacterized protein n=1 Tax=Nonomuraea endophytica TaxID=714136 RepID=A0A7W8AFB1_9ACTN|nr:hypothetical protein [Nonomuraea endophytica]MBB5084080.1 hypothetical protein [Nonomuraea endophytica]